MNRILISIMLLVLISGCSMGRYWDKHVIEVTPYDDLQNIIDQSSDNTAIVFSKGVYKLSKTLRIDQKRKLLLDGNESMLISDHVAGDMIAIDKSIDITLANFKIKHTQPKGQSHCTGNVIMVSDSRGVLLEDNDIKGRCNIGVAAYRVDYLELQNNRVSHNKAYPIFYVGSSVTLIGNIFERNGINGIAYSSGQGGFRETLNLDVNRKGLVMKDNQFNP